ncbi:MAG: A/G-specific adenine glycosylase [Saprospiraceae bacterium]|jgi:A/G-specific adenine glycosylase
MSPQSEFATQLLHWHEEVDRRLPWKEDRDPYKTWLSEIIMQQTRVAQGTPYYLKFVEAFPTIIDLANAPEGDVMKLWQGLGYYSRARNLHHAAKTVRDKFGGQFPTEYKDILSLKGVGKYTAAAISSFAYGQEYAVVDGNVIRVLSRYLGITDAVDHSVTLKLINEKAAQLIKGADPAAYNQAIMDFGATYCTPKSPDCIQCIFSSLCKAHNKGLVIEIPYKAKKIKKRTRHLHYLIIHDRNGNTIIRHRKEKDIWQSLYDYPCMEMESEKMLNQESIAEYLLSIFGLQITDVKFPNKTYKHILTHQTLFAQFYYVQVYELSEITSPYIIVSNSDVGSYALPVLLTNHLKDEGELTLFD